MSWWVGVALLALGAEPAPSDQTVLFYNARLAIRDGRPTDALKLWLLRNSLKEQTQGGRHDEEFRSVVWAAMGALGLCADGYPKDLEGGAGLWPLSLHNWVLIASRGIPAGPRNPYDAFEVGRQQRLISLHDVLSAPELRTVSFYRTGCFLPESTLIAAAEAPSLDLADRLSTGPFLQRLLKMSLASLVREKVVSVAAIEARIFDLDLSLAQLRDRKSRREGQLAKQRARRAGVSDTAAEEVLTAARVWPKDSAQGLFLQRALTWQPSEWLGLSAQRRLFLFLQARPFAPDAKALDPLMLAMIDALIARKAGAELESWLGAFDAKDTVRRRLLTEGERGKRLLDLEPITGFRERSTVALQRGVAFLEAGALQEALRSFAFAMAHADESRESAITLSLSRRWVSYVLSRYETNAEVIATLKALVPKQEYNFVIEDLIWRAALRSDEKSFELVVASLQRGSALDARVLRLRLLAQGKQGALATQLRDAAENEPHLTLRFARLYLEKLEAEDVDVRRSHVPMLKLLKQIFDGLLAQTKAKAQARAAEELVSRAQAILEGLNVFDTSIIGKARELSPRQETFAGNIRVAPVDPLPWPFEAPQVDAPSAFTPLVLTPVEWRGAGGALVFGWKVTDEPL